jgi:membrane protease YdiL (CAAX protease family)
VRALLRSWLIPERAGGPEPITDPAQRRVVVIELAIVFAMTVGLSGARSLLSLVDSLLRPEPLSQQAVALNVPQATVDLIDLLKQLLSALQLFTWGALGLYLLWRAGFRLASIGIDRTSPGRDLRTGAGLALLIGIPGLGLYLLAYRLGASLAVLPSTLDDTWWRPVALTIAAAANAWAEEVLVVGYLISRLRQLGWGENAALLVSALLRGSYHLYQGFGGFLGNLVMGLIFGRLWQRTNRLWPLIIAHTLLDVVAFVGYTLLRGRVGWLP